MIRPGFLSSADRLELEACVRRQHEDHGIARRANAFWLLDDGESCARIAKFLYLDEDTIRGDSYRLREKRRSGLLQKPAATHETATAST
jgi:hypothetical protein